MALALLTGIGFAIGVFLVFAGIDGMNKSRALTYEGPKGPPMTIRDRIEMSRRGFDGEHRGSDGVADDGESGKRPDEK